MILVLLAFSSGVAAEWREFQVDVAQEEFYPKEHRAADHLEPDGGLFPDSYYLIEFAKLPALERRPWLVRVCLNSNKTAAVVMLYTNDLPFLSKMAAKDKLRAQIGEMRVVPDKSCELDLETATLLYRTWVNALLESHYSKTDRGGLDGVIYHFGSWIRGLGWLFGCTWSPEADLPPKWLTEVGTNLRVLVETPEAEVEPIKRRITDRCNETMKYLKKHGKL